MDAYLLFSYCREGKSHALTVKDDLGQVPQLRFFTLGSLSYPVQVSPHVLNPILLATVAISESTRLS